MSIAQPGDIFAIPISEKEYAFGRVMLNIQAQCIDRGLLPEGSPLSFYTSTILIEIYKESSSGYLPEERTVLVPGILTSDGFIKNGQWLQKGFKKINPEQVEFPEGLTHEGTSKATLVKGELKFELEMDYAKVEEIGIPPGTKAAMVMGEIYLYMAGRKDEIDNPRLVNKELRNLANHDIRFSKHKEEIYALLPKDAHSPYYVTAKNEGLDLARFYS